MNLQPVLQCEEITADWIQMMLTYKLGTDIHVSEVSFSNIEGNVGILSNMYRVKVSYNSEHVLSLIAKLLPDNPEALITGNWDVAESNFYSEIVPFLSSAVDDQLSVPECFYSSCLHSENENKFTLVMEDLKESGFTSADLVCGLQPLELTSAVKAIAKIHAASLVQDQVLLQNLVVRPGLDRVADVFRIGLRSLIKKITDQTQRRQLLEKLEKLAERDSEDFLKDCGGSGGLLYGLVHGDFTARNVLFKYSESCCECRIIDWQFCRYGNCLVDIATLIGYSADAEVRRNNEEHILKQYVNTLISFPRVKETLDDLEITTEMIIDEYKVCQRRSLLMILVFYGLAGLVKNPIADQEFHEIQHRVIDLLQDFSDNGVI